MNNKLNVGTYTLYAYVNGETKPVAETEFTVVQRAVTLRVVTPKDGVDQTLVNPSTQLSLSADTKNMTADEIKALHLGYTAVNTAGNDGNARAEHCTQQLHGFPVQDYRYQRNAVQQL